MIKIDAGMHEETPVSSSDSIQVLVHKVEVCAKKSDNHVIAAAMSLRELRCRIRAGDAGDVEWSVWAGENIKLSKSRLRELLSISEADDPGKEAVRQREMNSRRQANYRARQVRRSDLAPECREIIKWARKAPVSEAREILRIIHARSRLPKSVSITRPPQQASIQLLSACASRSDLGDADEQRR